MAVSKVTSKPVAKAAVKPAAQVDTATQSGTAFRVDRMIVLGQILDDLKPQQDEFEEHKKALATEAKDENAHDPSQPVRFEGSKGYVLFTAASNTTALNTDEKFMKALHKELGDGRFYALVKVGLTDLKKALSDIELAKFDKYMEPAVGPRKLKEVKPVI